jgi:transposase
METNQLIINEYKSGVSSPDLAKKYNKGNHTILKILRDNGVEIRSKGGKKKQYDYGWTQEFIKRYKSGQSIQSIAKELRVGYGTVMRSLKDIKKRKVGLRKQTILMPTESYKLAYIAGIFDGEGNLQFRNRYKSISCKVAIYNTNIDVINWLKNLMGGKVRWDKSRIKKGWLPCGSWELYRAKDVLVFLNAILPFLIIKKDAAKTSVALINEQWPAEWLNE